MKKLLFLGLVLTSLSTTLSSCSGNKGTAETSTATGTSTTADIPAKPVGNPGPGVAAEIYTCTMHPEVITNAPGKYPSAAWTW